MRVTVMPMVFGALGTVPKGLEERLEELKIRGRIETIQTTVLLKSARILWIVLENWEDLLSFRIHWKPTSKCWCEKQARSINILIIIVLITVLFSVFLSNTNNFQRDSFELQMKHKQVLFLQLWMVLRVMVMKSRATLSISPELEPHHRMQVSVIIKIPIVAGSYTSAVSVF